MNADLETLIDLNADSDPEPSYRDTVSSFAETSLLKRRAATPEDRQKTALWGFLTGLGFSAFVAIPVALIVIFNSSLQNIWIVALVLGAGATIGALVNTSLLETECREGYVRIDREHLEYWTHKGAVTVPLDTVFGAGPEKWTIREVLRMSILSDHKRGFEFLIRSFKHYEAVSGPARKIGGSVESGNALARKAIAHHVNERHRAGLPVAKLPPYAFHSVQTHKQFLIAGDTVIEAAFECDGTTLVYENKDNRYEISVTAVRETKIHEARSQYGRTAYKVNMKLDLSSGYEELKIDILRMPHAEEIDKYCRALPLLFPVQEADGYWN